MIIKKINKVELILLDGQVDIILKALELYIEEINKKYHNRKFSLDKKENIEKSIIRHTYHQIEESKNNEIRLKKSYFDKIRKIS